jgi:hypothetical protein
MESLSENKTAEIAQILSELARANILTFPYLCVISKSWLAQLSLYPKTGISPGPIQSPDRLNENSDLIPENLFTKLCKHFGSASKKFVFVIDRIPDFSPISILVYLNEDSCKSVWVSEKMTIGLLKEFICEQEGIDKHKVAIRIMEENQGGATAFRVLNEDCTVSEAKIKKNSKVSIDKHRRRVVRFVESDEEADKVLEISVKHKNSTGKLYKDSAFNQLSLR